MCKNISRVAKYATFSHLYGVLASGLPSGQLWLTAFQNTRASYMIGDPRQAQSSKFMTEVTSMVEWELGSFSYTAEKYCMELAFPAA